MFSKQPVEVTVIDLEDEFDQARDLYTRQVESIQIATDERQQVVRNRLAVLEAEDTDLQNLKHRLTL